MIYHIKKWDGGMLDSPDPEKLPGNAGKLVMGVDSRRNSSSIRKPPGIKTFTFGGVWPPVGVYPLIQSVGQLRYNRVWDGAGNRVNDIRELYVIQVKNMPSPYNDHDLVWYEVEHTVDDPVWVLNGPYYVDADEYSEAFAGEWGLTNPEGRINWEEYLGVLYGACGVKVVSNECVSNPITWRYVNRWPTSPAYGEVEGFFKIFDNNNNNHGHCLVGEKGLFRSIGIPNYYPVITINNSSPYRAISGFGFTTSRKLKYIIVPVYDGHQNGLFNDVVTADVVIYSEAITTNSIKLNLSITDIFNDPSFPHRVTGFNVYHAYYDYGNPHAVGFGNIDGISGVYDDYKLMAYIDIRDGVPGIGTIKTFEFVHVSGTSWYCRFYFTFDELNAPADNFFNFLHFDTLDAAGDKQEYRITSSTVEHQYQNQWIGRINFNAPTTATFPNEYITINGRWNLISANTVEIYLFDTGISIGSAPAWLKSNSTISDQPEVLPRYTHQAFYKDRHFVIGNYFDGKRQRHLMRWSNAVNENFSGFDLYPNGIYVPTDEGDEIVGIVSRIDFLYVITRMGRLFKYILTEGGMYLMEQPWQLGLKSPTSLQVIGNKFFFLGARDADWGPMVLAGPGDPIDLGVLNKNLIEATKLLPNIRPDLAKGFYRSRENKYILSIPQVVDHG